MIEFAFDQSGERITFESDGMTLVGTLYTPENEKASPAIVLIHGSTPEGRNMGLYRILGDELAQSGYTVFEY